MRVYRKAIPSTGMQLHAMSLRTIWSIPVHLGKKQMPVRYHFLNSECKV